MKLTKLCKSQISMKQFIGFSNTSYGVIKPASWILNLIHRCGSLLSRMVES
jgi:hypothetical protein